MCNRIRLSIPDGDEDVEKFGADGHLLATSNETKEEISVEIARFLFSFYILSSHYLLVMSSREPCFAYLANFEAYKIKFTKIILTSLIMG